MNILFLILERNHISVCLVLKVSVQSTIWRDTVLYIQEWKRMTALYVANHLMIKATYNSTWEFILETSLTGVPHVNGHSLGNINLRIMSLCIQMRSISVLYVTKVSNLETALLNMPGIIWEKDTDVPFVDTHLLLRMIYMHINILMLLNPNNCSVKRTNIIWHVHSFSCCFVIHPECFILNVILLCLY